eukprot:GFYU01006740.1.p1 GENE.GFYU01006740.1~~GFYU01006740.1.p1  ORF type:complete len:329 (-),score=67.11 GFYU01006740.1:74-1060(-)
MDAFGDTPFDLDCEAKCKQRCLVYRGEAKEQSASAQQAFPRDSANLTEFVAGHSCPGLSRVSPHYYDVQRVANEKYVAHGRGMLWSRAGPVLYDGEFENGFRQGYGEGQVYTHDGKMWVYEGKYRGEWAYGLRHGKGFMTYPEGDTYSGEWVKGIRQGFGTETYSCGGELTGQWSKGKRHGCGVFRWPSGKVEDREYDMGALIQVTDSRRITESDRAIIPLSTSIQDKGMSDVEKRNLDTTWKSYKSSMEASETVLKLTVENLESQLEEERSKSACLLCGVNTRNSVVMPCLHVLYCGDCLIKHQKKSNTCPSCHTAMSGLLKCKLTA